MAHRWPSPVKPWSWVSRKLERRGWERMAYVFEEPPEGWTGVLSETAKLVAETPTIVDLLGYSVAAAGVLVFAGSPSPFANGTEQGRICGTEGRSVGGPVL